MNLGEVEKYLKRKNTNFDMSILEILKELKKEASDNLNEDLANKIWGLEQIFNVQKMYVDMFNCLKDEKYFDAWRLIERIDIEIESLADNFHYSGSEYNINFILKTIKYYEKLFPYKLFISRESIIKKEECSICGKINTIRNKCEHKVGKLYMGEMCYRNVLEFEFLGFAIVENPFDKYTVLFPQDKEYNYDMLKNLMENLKSPYDKWCVDIEILKRPGFENVKRNDKCPCGSQKKYKKCCMGTERELTEHHKVTLLDFNKNVSIPFQLMNRLK